MEEKPVEKAPRPTTAEGWPLPPCGHDYCAVPPGIDAPAARPVSGDTEGLEEQARAALLAHFHGPGYDFHPRQSDGECGSCGEAAGVVMESVVQPLLDQAAKRIAWLDQQWQDAGEEERRLTAERDSLLDQASKDRAETWDEGYRSGFSNAMRRMSDEPNAPTTANPYLAFTTERPDWATEGNRRSVDALQDWKGAASTTERSDDDDMHAEGCGLWSMTSKPGDCTCAPERSDDEGQR